jgi:hypothetical protein
VRGYARLHLLGHRASGGAGFRVRRTGTAFRADIAPANAVLPVVLQEIWYCWQYHFSGCHTPAKTVPRYVRRGGLV